VVNIRITADWDVTPCAWVGTWPLFWGTCCCLLFYAASRSKEHSVVKVNSAVQEE